MCDITNDPGPSCSLVNAGSVLGGIMLYDAPVISYADVSR